MKIGITGATGFVGRHLIKRHLDRGDEVIYLTRSNSGAFPDAKVFLGDLTGSKAVLRKFVSGVDILYHCAAEINDPNVFNSTNVLGTQNLLDAAIGNVGRWIHLSSVGVYGSDQSFLVSEDAELRPKNLYEISKARADNLVLNASNLHQLNAFILRPSNIYAPDMPNKSLYSLISIINRGLFFYIGKVNCIVNYIHVENVVDAMIQCGFARPEMSGVYNVSDSCDLEAFISLICIELKRSPPKLHLPETFVRLACQILPNAFSPMTSARVDALTNKIRYNTQKIENQIGFKNNISLHDGISELTRYWKSAYAR